MQKNKRLTRRDLSNISSAFARYIEELKNLSKDELKELFQSKKCGPTKRQAIIQLVQEKIDTEDGITINTIDNTN